MRIVSKYIVLQLMLATILCTLNNAIGYAPQKEVQICPTEINDILSAREGSYVFVGPEMSPIVKTLQRIAALAPQERPENLVHLNSRLQKGYKTALKATVLAVLDEAELMLEHHHANITDEQELKALIHDLEQARCMMHNKTLDIVSDPRAPRPGETYGIETTAIPSDDGDAVCCEIPRDVYIHRDLVVGGDLTVEGAVIIVGPVTFNSNITLQPLFPDHDVCIIWLENAVDGGAEKVRVCDSAILNDKGLIISVDGGVTQNFRITNAGDTSLADSLILVNSTAPTVPLPFGTGNIYKGADRFIHNFGGFSTAVGVNASNFTTTGIANTALGYQALTAVTTGSNNVAVGNNALFNNTTGGNNVAVGLQALEDNTSGMSNVAIGYQAMLNTTTANFNIAIGQNAMGVGVTTGAENITIGASSLKDATSATQNTAVGNGALFLTTTGARNVAIGYLTGSTLATGLVTGNDNVLVGYQAGAGLTGAETGNIFIGSGQSGVPAENNTTRIGFGNATTSCFIVGINSANIGATANIVGVNAASRLGTTATDFTLDGNLDVNGTIAFNGGPGVLSANGAGLVTANATTANAVQIGNASGNLTSLAVGTDGQVLIGATGAAPAFATLTSADGTITFTPGANTLSLQTAGTVATSFPTDAGTAIPAAGALTIAGGFNINTSGAGSTVTVNLDDSINFPDATSPSLAAGNITKAGTHFLHNFGTNNTFLGVNAGNFTMTGVINSGIGFNTLPATTTGSGNVAIGAQAMLSTTIGNTNTAVGANALRNNISGSDNTVLGNDSGLSLSTGSQNTCIGGGAGGDFTSGNNNVTLGYRAGSGVVGSGANTGCIYIGSGMAGAPGGESFITRIGNVTGGTTQECYIDGIQGVDLGPTADIVGITSNDQLGTTAVDFTLTGNLIGTGNATLDGYSIINNNNGIAPSAPLYLGGTVTSATVPPVASLTAFGPYQTIVAYFATPRLNVISSQSGGITDIDFVADGVYDISFEGFSDLPMIQVTPACVSPAFITVEILNQFGVRVRTYDQFGVPDASGIVGFYLTATGPTTGPYIQSA